MLEPARTGTGLAEFVTDKSADAPTCTLADAVLLVQVGSLAAQVTESVSVIVEPEATLVATFTTKVKFAVEFAARLPVVVQV